VQDDATSGTPTSQPTATTTSAGCNKMVKYDDKTGIVPNRYVLMLYKNTAQNYMMSLIKLLKRLMVSATHSDIEVKEVTPTEHMKMVTIEINKAGLEWVSYK